MIREQGRGRHAATVSPEGRALLKPIERLRDEIRTIVENNRKNPEVSVIGAEALTEANDLILRADTFVNALEGKKVAVKSYKEAEFQLSKLREQEEQTTSEQERESLRLTIEARQNEVEQYGKAVQSLEATKVKLHDAQSALIAIKAQLTAAAAGGESEGLDTEGLTGMVGRLRTLSASLDEAEELRERIP